jgi:hypothetical protein
MVNFKGPLPTPAITHVLFFCLFPLSSPNWFLMFACLEYLKPKKAYHIILLTNIQVFLTNE